MGILNFLKNLRNKKPESEPKTEEIHLENLEQKLESLAQERLSSKQDELTEITNEILKEKSLLQENLEKLEKAEPKNNQIPERALQIMQSNREVFLQKTSALIPKINPPTELKELFRFTEEFDKIMDNFSKSVVKNHQVTSEFLPKEAGLISVSITKIDKLAKHSKKTIEQSQIPKIEELKKALTQIQNKIKQKQDFENQIRTKNEEARSNENNIKANKDKINQLEKGKDYQELSELQKEQEQLQDSISSNNTNLSSAFSEIEAGLKRYTNLNKTDKLAKDYLRNPTKTLLVDDKLEILSLVEKLKTYLKQGSIQLNDKKMKKVQEGLEKLNKEYLQNQTKQTKNLQKILEATNQKINKSNITKQIRSIEEESDSLERELTKTKSYIHKLEQDLQKIDSESLKQTLQEEINSALNQKIKIA